MIYAFNLFYIDKEVIESLDQATMLTIESVSKNNKDVVILAKPRSTNLKNLPARICFIRPSNR